MNRSIVFIISALVLFTACEEKVDVQLGDTEPKVVVEGYWCSETDSSYVRLSRSIDYFNTSTPPAITDATVEISDGQNSILLTHDVDGYYRPQAGYKADTGKVYTLKVISDGETFTSSSKLNPMFEVDPVLQFEYKPASGFIEEGYAVTYYSIDNRPGEIYTRFNFGQNDTIFDQEILFTSADLIKGQNRPFELPFYRAQSGDSVMLIFRSLDVSVARYFEALNALNSGAPGPFQTPPANPPTNISGGAVGYFMATDITRIGQIAP
ncbi:MAG: DUF4249 domain-containing protein [Bacteroidetes bacterium]|nr:MAG: DUF4249 domain-containing protein [Bacteroidota bacterium]